MRILFFHQCIFLHFVKKKIPYFPVFLLHFMQKQNHENLLTGLEMVCYINGVISKDDGRDDEMSTTEQKNKKKRKRIVIGIGLVAVIAAGILYNRMQPKEVTNYDTAFEEDQIKPENEKQKSGTEKGIQIPGYKTITVAAGSKDVDVELMNPEENEVYFEISFYLPDTDETIYTSKKIKPGQHIYHITLNRELQAGEYPLTIRYATCSADEKMTPKNGAEVNCTLKAI